MKPLSNLSPLSDVVNKESWQKNEIFIHYQKFKKKKNAPTFLVQFSLGGHMAFTHGYYEYLY
jgi:hypothetical protein